MMLKLKYIYINLRQRITQFFHRLTYGNRVVYTGKLIAEGKYAISLDNSKSSILFEKGVAIRSNCNFLAHNNGFLKISKNVFMNNGCSLNSMEKIEIGENTIFGEGVKIYDHNHKHSDSSRPLTDQGFNTAPVYVGKNCWISSNVIILKGVSIGDNTIIGAGCLIYKNIPANSIVKNNSTLTIESNNLR